MTVKFVVHGVPVPQGSMRAFVNRKTGVPVVVHGNPRKLIEWRESVKMAAEKAVAEATERGERFVVGGAWSVIIDFSLPKPKSSPTRTWPNIRPDIDKLARSVLDALTGVLWEDDGRVCVLQCMKIYADGTPMATVTAWQP